MPKTKLVEKENGRVSITQTKWNIIADYLVNQEWNGTEAYLKANPKTSRNVAHVQISRLLRNDKFLELVKDKLRVNGVNEERILNYWNEKIDKSKKEEVGMKASENVAKYLQMSGFSPDTQAGNTIAIQLNFGTKKEEYRKTDNERSSETS